MRDYQLSAQLKGHDSDVRAVQFPTADLVLSASRDHSVRVWRKLAGRTHPTFEATVTTQGHDFINALTFAKPNPPTYPEGLIISGGKDSIIEVKKPTSTQIDNAERLLIGHSHNICSLDVGQYLVSGAWDGQARVWSLGKWETEFVLDHDGGGSVWAVVAYDAHVVLTGCADCKIRVFDLRRSAAGEVKAGIIIPTPAVVRALCKLPTGLQGHPSGAEFASASNDGIIRLWKMNGQQIAELHGHDSFIYSLACTRTGEIVSSGEDRTVRIWRGTTCVQTITHPAISVWSVSVCGENNDIVSGASDGLVRVFSRSQDRVADADTLAQFEQSIQASAIPQQQLDEKLNKEKLDPPKWLEMNAGAKEGQVKMILEDNGSVGAYTWSMSQQKWVNVGTVVDSSGSSGRKVEYMGQEYDYVFDVDIEDGKPPLKLPYNLSENPYERATKFLGDNELPMSYLDSVAHFITENTKGASLGASSSAPSADPFGTEARYRPGDEAKPAKRKYLPHEEYLALTQAKFEPIQKKMLSLNANLISSGSKHLCMNPSETSVLEKLVSALKAASASQKLNVPNGGVDLILKVVTQWPYGDRLAGLDLLRCMIVSPAVASVNHSQYGDIVRIVLASSLETDGAVNENSVMMALRAITNLFASEEGRKVAAMEASSVVSAMERIVGVGDGSSPIGLRNRNVQIALTSAAFNYACLAYSERKKKQDSLVEAVALLCNILGRVLLEQADAEVVYRALMALGMVLFTGDDYKDAARALGADDWVRAAVGKASESRVKDLGQECLSLLR